MWMSPGIIVGCHYLCQMQGKITKDWNKIWKLQAKPCNPAFYLLCNFDLCVTVSVKIEHQVIILHSEQSNTAMHVHFIIATCCILTLGRH